MEILDIPDAISVLHTVSKIGKGAFKNRDDILSVFFPESIAEIEADAFRDCIWLGGEIIFPQNLIKIGSSAFQDWILIQKVNRWINTQNYTISYLCTY